MQTGNSYGSNKRQQSFRAWISIKYHYSWLVQAATLLETTARLVDALYLAIFCGILSAMGP